MFYIVFGDFCGVFAVFDINILKIRVFFVTKSDSVVAGLVVAIEAIVALENFKNNSRG